MLELWQDFYDSAAPALFDAFPEDYEAASPLQFSGVWSPWMGVTDDERDAVWGLEEEEDDEVAENMLVAEAMVVESQRVGVVQHLLAPSIGVLLIVGILVVILQFTARFVKRDGKKLTDSLAAEPPVEYGTV